MRKNSKTIESSTKIERRASRRFKYDVGCFATDILEDLWSKHPSILDIETFVPDLMNAIDECFAVYEAEGGLDLLFANIRTRAKQWQMAGIYCPHNLRRTTW